MNRLPPDCIFFNIMALSVVVPAWHRHVAAVQGGCAGPQGGDAGTPSSHARTLKQNSPDEVFDTFAETDGRVKHRTVSIDYVAFEQEAHRAFLGRQMPLAHGRGWNCPHSNPGVRFWTVNNLHKVTMRKMTFVSGLQSSLSLTAAAPCRFVQQPRPMKTARNALLVHGAALHFGNTPGQGSSCKARRCDEFDVPPRNNRTGRFTGEGLHLPAVPVIVVRLERQGCHAGTQRDGTLKLQGKSTG